MTACTNIFLVGPMGAGKTTIGRHLAEMLSWHFLDSDHEIEKRTGATIPWIFDVEGEAGFRRREEAMIAELTALKYVVLATGGGAVLREANRLHLRQRGTVVYLETPVAMQLERTAHDKNRPLLQTQNPQKKLSELLEIRDPLYRDVAHLIVPTTSGCARDLAQSIIQSLNFS
ncbi:MAG TPA: shikimate kinase AroK [Agitococcus sp.]|nr:shikimate kinase AroK [Agitococcus sp.]